MIARMKALIIQCKRLVIDVIISVGLLAVYFTGLHSELPGPLQLITFKVILVSMAIVHAHLAGKLLLGKVVWDENGWSPKKTLRVGLYLVFVIAYSMGG